MLVQFSSASVEVAPMQGHSHDGARHVPDSPWIATSGIPHLQVPGGILGQITNWIRCTTPVVQHRKLLSSYPVYQGEQAPTALWTILAMRE